MEKTNKEYLGDGVYAEFVPATMDIILTATGKTSTLNIIVLEPETLDKLGDFVKRMIYERNKKK